MTSPADSTTDDGATTTPNQPGAPDAGTAGRPSADADARFELWWRIRTITENANNQSIAAMKLAEASGKDSELAQRAAEFSGKQRGYRRGYDAPRADPGYENFFIPFQIRTISRNKHIQRQYLQTGRMQYARACS